LQTQAGHKIKTHILCSIIFSQNLYPLRDNVAKCDTARETTDANIIRRTRNACWIPKATNTRSQYVIPFSTVTLVPRTRLTLRCTYSTLPVLLFFLSLTYPRLSLLSEVSTLLVALFLSVCWYHCYHGGVRYTAHRSVTRMHVGRSGVPTWIGRAILLYSKSLRQALWPISSSVQSVPLFLPGGKAAGT